MSIEAMKQALEALEGLSEPYYVLKAQDALRTAIAEAEKQEPVAWMYDFMSDDRDEIIRDWTTQEYAEIEREKGFNVRPLYTAPRQEQYDQTSLELCEECGWRAVIPGDGCLVCARQKAKPVAYVDERIHGWPDCFVMEPDPPHTVPLYTEPREWVGLTEDEMNALVSRFARYELARAIEAKLKEKNT